MLFKRIEKKIKQNWKQIGKKLGKTSTHQGSHEYRQVHVRPQGSRGPAPIKTQQGNLLDL